MAKEKNLSEKQRNILNYIYTSVSETGRPPTIREVCKAAKISSTSVANYNLDRLKEGGYIVRDAEVSRGLRLTDRARYLLDGVTEMVEEVVAPVTAAAHEVVSRLISIPFAGSIAAGIPINTNPDAYTYDDGIEVSSAMLQETKDLFALRVKGDSMIDAMVNDGDIVIMKSQKLARNGEMVAVWLSDEESTTLKYFYHEGERIRLQPANPTMEPIYVNPAQVQIQGKVVMVMRQTV
ncbi:MAG: transcriptional repressor LexA [Chloroflexi bacterium]|nr:transcriptional repressor LexA [Chloroflexota bacterium]MBP8055908.1 transcriptional repressor LexA [Chloroflexota bacterium]